MKLGFGDVLTMSWGSSIYSSSDRNTLWWDIDVGLASWLDEEDDEAWGRLLQLRRGGGVVEIAGDILQQEVGAILLLCFFSFFLLFSSPLLFSLLFSLLCSFPGSCACVSVSEREVGRADGCGVGVGRVVPKG